MLTRWREWVLKSHPCSPKSNDLEVGCINSACILLVLPLVRTWFYDHTYPSGDWVRLDLTSTVDTFPKERRCCLVSWQELQHCSLAFMCAGILTPWQQDTVAFQCYQHVGVRQCMGVPSVSNSLDPPGLDLDDLWWEVEIRNNPWALASAPFDSGEHWGAVCPCQMVGFGHQIGRA